ncbi:hybrid sensor histidine kinase/response regulator [Leptospira perolatii]|uniref:histidine kinase n=1 Tax=Leptospira perolatii TaxID=2023191 RepID=A0A2M9ZSU3_9LEPT|nr:response regulator [Leptospira perolatii]PJZ71518.1 hybrid sensor histidine kinase/response regulator [Leptospira perolatii]PJZ75051.1 hybrid sensor histidine kinase/response regulator [Leptospira perolatii]
MAADQPSVLVIDDEAEIRTALERVISREGYSVFVAEDFDSAMRIVHENSVDIVISDILMGGKDGIEVTKEIKKYNSNIPVILITGNPQLETAEEALRTRAFDYISKPVTRQNLLVVLENARKEKEDKDRKSRRIMQTVREKTHLAQQFKDLNFRNSLILESTGDCVITLDESLIIRWVNESTCRHFHYRENEIIGQDVSILIPEPKREAYTEKVNSLIARKHDRQIARLHNAELMNKKGEVRTFDISVCRYMIGGRAYYTGIARDITQKLLISEKLIDAERRAFLTTIASSIGHEINNALTAIQGFIEVARLPDSDEALKDKAIQVTWNQITKLKNLTFNLLQLGKPGDIGKDREVLDLNEVIESVIEVFRKASRLKNCEITFEKPREKVQVYSNSDQLSLLLSNIVLNSADATQNKGNIQISLTERNHHPVLKIKDNGVGMSPEVQKKIFQPYFTTKKTGQGTGLGMFVAKEIADLFGIRIEIDSELDKGTEFRLVFPDKLPN